MTLLEYIQQEMEQCHLRMKSAANLTDSGAIDTNNLKDPKKFHYWSGMKDGYLDVKLAIEKGEIK